VQKKISTFSISIAAIAAVVVGLQLGAFGVVLETQISGITELPFSTFVLLMQPIHLAIGLVEGVVTAAVLCFVYQMRPEIMESVLTRTSIAKTVPVRNTLIVLALVTVLSGALFSVFASTYPDGLEWAMERTAGTAELEIKEPLLESAALVQEASSFMPDYDYKSSGEEGSLTGTSVAGIIGGLFTFALAGGVALLVSVIKKKNKRAVSI
jgi:cobalt/nickel transport system permease protein